MTITDRFTYELTIRVSAAPVKVPGGIITAVPVEVTPQAFLAVDATMVAGPVGTGGTNVYIGLAGTKAVPPPIAASPAPPIGISTITSWKTPLVTIVRPTSRIGSEGPTFLVPVWTVGVPVPPLVTYYELSKVSLVVVFLVLIAIVEALAVPRVGAVTGTYYRIGPDRGAAIGIGGTFGPVPNTGTWNALTGEPVAGILATTRVVITGGAT